ncbi:2OG-Fe(II) oxygenase [Thalassotalea eurytherma]|uniref:Prolyl 4-hydroxylase subunit alpha n=1 Tax=Thalassotalea eurytherma TaxID=1144278 RepID=A0ABQ6GXR9_9GAMM|nr:2OG-Fe(II) oxygenase [Thalassotalea eurytherma]GLX80738.1 prolyl 4-hydroxylase subunit alpha [Thalassotalea eurytherma]
MHHFIVEFKNALPELTCQQIIEKFEQDKNKQQGRIGSGVDISKKNSIDIHLSTLAHWKSEHQQINNLVFQGLLQYIKAYPHLITGAISPSIQDATTGKQTTLTPEMISKLDDAQLLPIVESIFELDAINLQKYTAKEGNFGHWHSEHFPHPTDTKQKSLHRVLLWLIYLNDVEEGGETDFLYQQASLKPSTGSLILSPCGFTHTHRGRTPISHDKYVLASWVNYKQAAQLYGRK